MIDQSGVASDIYGAAQTLAILVGELLGDAPNCHAVFPGRAQIDPNGNLPIVNDAATPAALVTLS